MKTLVLIVMMTMLALVQLAAAKACKQYSKRDPCNADPSGLCFWHKFLHKASGGECRKKTTSAPTTPTNAPTKAPTGAPTRAPTTPVPTKAPTTPAPTMTPVECSSFKQKIGCCGAKFAKGRSKVCVNAKTATKCKWAGKKKGCVAA